MSASNDNVGNPNENKLMTPTLNYNTLENALGELDPPAIEIVLESDP